MAGTGTGDWDCLGLPCPALPCPARPASSVVSSSSDGCGPERTGPDPWSDREPVWGHASRLAPPRPARPGSGTRPQCMHIRCSADRPGPDPSHSPDPTRPDLTPPDPSRAEHGRSVSVPVPAGRFRAGCESGDGSGQPAARPRPADHLPLRAPPTRRSPALLRTGGVAVPWLCRAAVPPPTTRPAEGLPPDSTPSYPFPRWCGAARLTQGGHHLQQCGADCRPQCAANSAANCAASSKQ